MSKIENFEELHCWQAARVLVKDVYRFSADGKLESDYDVRGQLRRAALSAMNNIAEGFGRFGDKEFIRFLDIAQSSVQEVQSMLYVCCQTCLICRKIGLNPFEPRPIPQKT